MAEEALPRRLPRTRSVDRLECLRSLASGKRVVHIGFAGGLGVMAPDSAPDGQWLHGQLSSVAAKLVGVDVDAQGVERARRLGFDAYVADGADEDALASLGLAPAEVVIAGEIIEHLESPGSFLDGLHALVAPEGRLVVTTPNAASMLNPLAAMSRYELVNPSHVSIYSWYTLSNMLDRHGWKVRDFFTYHHPLPPGRAGSMAEMAGRLVARVQRAAAKLWPFVDFGLIAVAAEGGPSS